MQELIGTVVAGYRISELLYAGAWDVFRGMGPDGGRVIVTITCPPAPDSVLANLALPFEGIPQLRATAPVTLHERPALAVIESEPPGVAISDLKWPLPISEVISVGLDLARLLQRLHAAGKFHGALRPQTTWIHTSGGRSSLAGTTPRPELAGLHCLAMRSAGVITPFLADVFCDSTIARAEPRGVGSDVGQLGMMLYRMAMRQSPFLREAGEPAIAQLSRAMAGDVPAWPAGDARTTAVEELARAALDPERAADRSLAPLLAGLEQYSHY